MATYIIGQKKVYLEAHFHLWTINAPGMVARDGSHEQMK